VCLETFTYPRPSVGSGSVMGSKFTISPKVKGRVLGICTLYDTFVIVLLLAKLSKIFLVKPVFRRYFRKLLVTTLSVQMTKWYIDMLLSFQIFLIAWAKFSCFVILCLNAMEVMGQENCYISIIIFYIICFMFFRFLLYCYSIIIIIIIIINHLKSEN
jgi:hypothetical protein